VKTTIAPTTTSLPVTRNRGVARLPGVNLAALRREADRAEELARILAEVRKPGEAAAARGIAERIRQAVV
jgi:hypothetical protein